MTHSIPTRGIGRTASSVAVLVMLGMLGAAGAQTIDPAPGPADAPAPGPTQLPAPAQARDTSPWYLGINQNLTRESNVLRAPDGGTVVSDSYSLTTLLAGFDQPFGRQRLFGDASVRSQAYSTNDQLDNTGYGLTVGLEWSTVERLSGRFAVSANRTAVSPADSAGLPANSEDSTQLEALVRLGLVTRLALEAEFIGRKVDYTATELAAREFKQDSVALRLRYRFSDLLNAGVGLRTTKAEYPRFRIDAVSGAAVADELKRNDIDLLAEWTPSPITTVSTRVSFGKSEYLQNTSRDYDGATGFLSVTWRPTSKLSVATTVSRESGQETSLVPGATTATGAADPSTSRYADTSRITNSLGIASTYAATAKINLTARAQVDRRSLVESVVPGAGAPATQDGLDTTQTLSVGFSWLPTRSLSFGCNVGRESRSTRSALSTEYNSDIFGCFGQFMLR